MTDLTGSELDVLRALVEALRHDLATKADMDRTTDYDVYAKLTKERRGFQEEWQRLLGLHARMCHPRDAA